MICEINVSFIEKESGYRSSEFSDKEYSAPGSGKKKKKKGRHCFFSTLVCLMVFNTTFNNISVIFWQSVSLVEELENLEKTTDLSQATDKLYHIMSYTSP